MNMRIIAALIPITTAPFLASRLGAAPNPPTRNVEQEDVTALTREQLNTRVPNFYCFEYHAEPQPGKRFWLRISDTTWIERYPDGLESRFRVLGHTMVKEMWGTLVVKVDGDERQTGAKNLGGLQAFIPDKGNKVMHHWYRNLSRGDQDWSDLGSMLNVE